MLVAVKLRREERRLVEWFRARGALDADRAVVLTSDGVLARFIQHRFEGARVLRATGERYYFDETSYAAFRARRRKRAALVVAALVVGLLIAFLTGAFF
jgi:hypothetical protein